MVLSLFISVVLCFKGAVLVAGTTLLSKECASWSDRPFIVGHEEDEFSLVISTENIIDCST
jgi:hypothetical protein